MTEEATKTASRTPEEYRALFERHDIVPALGVYLEYDGGSCEACAIGIRLVEKFGNRDAAVAFRETCNLRGMYEELSGNFDMPVAFWRGLDHGWEGTAFHGELSNEDYLQGYVEGRAAWVACEDIASQGLECAED